jgi:Mitochondrial biogenesis AIM24
MNVLPDWQVYSDGDLARAAAAGDREAFAAIDAPRRPAARPATYACEQRSSKHVRFSATGRSCHCEPTPIKGVAMDAKIIGNVMPVLEVTLNRGEPLIAESGDLSWMTESIQLRTSTKLAGAVGIFGTLKTHGRRRLVHD